MSDQYCESTCPSLLARITRCVALLGLCVSAPTLFADTCEGHNEAGEWQLVFADEFDGDSLDRGRWETEFLWGPGVVINNELQYYVNDGQHDYNPFTVADGQLAITADKTRFRPNELYLTRSVYSDSVAELLWRVPPGAVRYDVLRDGELVATVTGGSYLDQSLHPGGDYQFEVIAYDAFDNVLVRAQLSLSTDDRPQPRVEMPFSLGLRVQVYGPRAAELLWQTPNRAGVYLIERNGEPYRRLEGADFSSLYESDLQPGTDYLYRVTALDRCGEPIISDSIVLNTASSPLAVVAAADELLLSSRIYSVQTAELFWNQIAGAQTYEVWRNGVEVRVDASRSLFVDDLVPGIDVRYEVVARDADGRELGRKRRTLNTADNSFALNRQPYVSGIITSYERFRFLYGKVEVRARLPAGQGLWSAFWLLNAYYRQDQPADPEIDIMEGLGHAVTTANHAYHWHTGNTSDVDGRQRFSNEHASSMADFSADFHTYGVEWTPGRIIWLVDGIESHRLEGPEVSSEQMYVIANLAVGGAFPGDPDATTVFPAALEVDYIRVWQKR